MTDISGLSLVPMSSLILFFIFRIMSPLLQHSIVCLDIVVYVFLIILSLIIYLNEFIIMSSASTNIIYFPYTADFLSITIAIEM